ncbi:MAG: hypothetical protein ACRC68_00405, partial [Clostridium sp.]
MILDEIVSKKMKRVEDRKRNKSLEEVKREAYKIVKLENKFDYDSLYNTLSSRKFSIIGEFK